MNSIKLGAIVAVLLVGQAMGQSMISYELELGGNNQRASWKDPSGTGCLPVAFSGGNNADGQVFSAGAVITWSAKVAVSGTHSTGAVPRGAANMVASLELRDSANALVALNAGGPAVAGPKWTSTINDGTTRTCSEPADPIQLAAFPVAWSGINGTLKGRVIDGSADGGPMGSAYFQYPSSVSFPTGSTAVAGTLVGIGAGYSNFQPSGCPTACGTSNLDTAGIGIETTTACAATLGKGPVFEGQIDTTNLAAGTYTLKIIPGSGNNILKVDEIPYGDCTAEGSFTGAFALKTDASAGDTITFQVAASAPCVRTVVGRYVFYPGSYYGAAIATDKKALLPGQVASRGTVVTTNGQANTSNVIAYMYSLTGVYIDVQYGANCTPLSGALDPAKFEFMKLGRLLSGAATAVAAPTSITAAAHPTLANTDRITIIWANNAIPNTQWVRIKVKSEANGGIAGLAADDVHYWGVAQCDGMNDTGTNVLVDGNDQIGPRPPNNHTTFSRALITDVWDFDKNSLVDGNDQIYPRPPRNTTTFSCLVLGTAP